MQAQYELRPVHFSDLPLLTEWSARPHVSCWFGGESPDANDLRDARVAMWIAMLQSRPFAYLQDYDVHGWSSHHLDFLPPGSRGIDMYIGDPDCIGLGHGWKLLRQHAEALMARGAPALGIDPHPDNQAAIRANEKAGFRVVGGPIDSQWGRVVLMTRRACTARSGRESP